MSGKLLHYGEHQTIEISTGNPETVNDASQKAPLGAIVRYKGKLYRYVLFNNGQGNVASAAGGVAYWFALNPATPTFTVTSDETDTIANINGVAGLFGAVITDGNYCFVQVGGTATAKTAASTAAGDHCIGSTTDLTFGRVAAGTAPTDIVFATSQSARNGTDGTNTVLLSPLLAW